MEDPKFLTFKDVVLRRSDLQSLSGQNYTNDSVIDFYFTCLSTCYQSDEILQIPTSISFLLANTSDLDSFISTINSLDLPNKKLVFFTVNDNSNLELSDDGTHWSLLVYCRKRNVFMHYDSVRQVNHELAFAIYKSLRSFINSDLANFMQCLVPRQRNAHDCGLCVMTISKVICDCYFNVDPSDDAESFNVMNSVDRDYVELNMRSKLLELILKLKDEE